MRAKKTIHNRLITITFITLICSFASKSNAQFNVKVGYNLNYSAFTAHNDLIAEYNTTTTRPSSEFNPLRFMSGLQVGFRQRSEFFGADLSWERSSANRSATTLNSSGAIVDQDFSYSTNRIGIGLEAYNGPIGIGANIYWEQFNIKSKAGNAESTESVFKDNQFGNRIYLILSAPGSGRVSVSLQPYIAIPYSAYDLSPLSSALSIPSSDSTKSRNLHFGFTIVLYNGPQQ